MSAVSTAPTPPQPRIGRLGGFAASRPLWTALAVAALLTVLRLNGTVDSDVAWQLWIAGRIHAGAHLYRDIIEVNPPLWFWMALPVDSAAAFFHVRPESVLVLCVGGLAMLALAGAELLIRAIPPSRRHFLLAYAALILLALPWVHVGQREQIALIGAVPYAALIAARRQGTPVTLIHALLIGAGAAIGFALKHYFLIVPLVLELWLVAGLGRNWRWRRPETLALLGVGALYAIAILLWADPYVTKVVPLVRLAYGELGTDWRHLFGPFVLAALVSLCLTAVQVRSAQTNTAPLASALLLTASAFGIAYFLQAKGWIYHTIPLVGCASLALAALLAESGAAMRLLRLVAPAILVFPLCLAATEQLNPPLPTPDLDEAVSGLHPGETVGFLAAETEIPWSVSLQHGLRYPSRYMGFWMLNAINANELRGNTDPRLSTLGRQVVAETVQDFTCTPPKRIIVPRPRDGEDAFDILPFFLRDPRFSALLSRYKVRSRTSVETFELASPLPPPSGACRTGI